MKKLVYVAVALTLLLGVLTFATMRADTDHLTPARAVGLAIVDGNLCGCIEMTAGLATAASSSDGWTAQCSGASMLSERCVRQWW